MLSFQARVLIILNLLNKGATTNCRDYDGGTCSDYVKTWVRNSSTCTLAASDSEHLPELARLLVDLGVFSHIDDVATPSRGCTSLVGNANECALQ